MGVGGGAEVGKRRKIQGDSGGSTLVLGKYGTGGMKRSGSL